MIKTLITIITVILIIAGISWGVAQYSRQLMLKTEKLERYWKVYDNQKGDFRFKYPSDFLLREEGDTIFLTHELSFALGDICDMGGGEFDGPELHRDFDITIKIVDKNEVLKAEGYNFFDILDEVDKSENPYDGPFNYEDGDIWKISIGFGNLDGYRIWRGMENCGNNIYYFSLDQKGEKFLIVDQEQTIFIPDDEKRYAMDYFEAEVVLQRILSTFEYKYSKVSK